MEKAILESIGQIGAGGIFALLIIRTVLDFLKSRNGKPNGGTCKYAPSEDFKDFKDDWEEFYKEWQKQTNLQEVIKELSVNIRENTKVLTSLGTEAKLNAEALKRISQDLYDIRRDSEH